MKIVKDANTLLHLTLVTQAHRAQLKKQKPCCIWLTGLSGAGKSTIASFLEQKLYDLGLHTFVLDGDNIRHGLNKDLGFTDQDRKENIRRISEVAKLMVDAGLVVIVAAISPFKNDRLEARAIFLPNEFFEVFVDAPLDECIRRDPKQLYLKAKRGEILNFTGLDSPYELPVSPEVVVYSYEETVQHCVDKIFNYYIAK